MLRWALGGKEGGAAQHSSPCTYLVCYLQPSLFLSRCAMKLANGALQDVAIQAPRSDTDDAVQRRGKTDTVVDRHHRHQRGALQTDNIRNLTFSAPNEGENAHNRKKERKESRLENSAIARLPRISSRRLLFVFHIYFLDFVVTVFP